MIIKEIFKLSKNMKKYKFILWEKYFQAKDENELELLFQVFSKNKKLSWIIHWNIIMEMDNDLEKIITTYKWLLKCLKYLNEKNMFLLVIKISDILPNILHTSEHLGEILAKIPNEENKLKLLKHLRHKGLSPLIRDAKDLWNILEWIYGNTQRKFLDFLWPDFIKQVFLSTNEIIIILYYLNNENKDYLIDMIGFHGIKNKVKTNENLLLMFQWLTHKKSKEFLKHFTKKEIAEMFKSEADFYHFMLRVPEDKEKIFLHHLWL